MLINIDNIGEDIKKRVRETLQEHDISVNKLAALTGIPQRTLQYQINENVKITLATFCAIIHSFQEINFYWWIYGDEASKYKSKRYPVLTGNTIVVEEQPVEYTTTDRNESLVKDLLHLEVSGLDENEKIIFATTNQYAPVIPVGCYVLANKITDWKKFLEFGRIYYLELKDNRNLFATIEAGDESKTFMIHPLNENSAGQPLPFSLIKSVWLTRRKIEEL
ncbi:MAG: hypothetical protein LUH10_17735 [Tannerellaceae bacterium]|nr:hypothetical protein [Tannerellaceae bacterium]